MQFKPFIAHRGARTDKLENTIEAFEYALAKNVNWIELDVQLSLDGVLIIFHDDCSQRMTGQIHDITQLTLAEIQNLDLQLSHLPGQIAKIPTLKHYLDWISDQPDAYTNIELKVGDQASQQQAERLSWHVLHLLDNYPQLQSRILLSSFSMAALSVLGTNKHGFAIEMAVDFIDWDHDFDYFRQHQYPYFQQWGCIAIGINADCLTEKRIVKLKALCGKVLAYGKEILSDATVQRLFQDGVDSVFIDDVDQQRFLTHLKPPVAKVALLATGDEIVQGQVVNTNTAKVAEQLKQIGVVIGTHMSCGDDQYEIENAINYLKQTHDMVITIGGLGPTVDDKTRHAVAFCVQKPLQWDQASWQRITERLAKRFDRIPESNQQQAYFPAEARILPNANGTADGCICQTNDQWIVMLPGPPRECLAMVEQQLLPQIRQAHWVLQPLIHYHWLLLGIAEADIAQQLKALPGQYQLTDDLIGYRCAAPYIEVKLQAPSDTNDEYRQTVEALKQHIAQIVQPYCVATNGTIASEQFNQYLTQASWPYRLTVQHDATQGYVTSLLHLAQRRNTIDTTQDQQTLEIQVHGLQQFWQGTTQDFDHLELIIKQADGHILDQKQLSVWIYSTDTKLRLFHYVYEWVCWQLVKWYKAG